MRAMRSLTIDGNSIDQPLHEHVVPQVDDDKADCELRDEILAVQIESAEIALENCLVQSQAAALIAEIHSLQSLLSGR